MLLPALLTTDKRTNLRDDAHGRPQGALGDVTNIMPVDADGASLHVIQPQQQPADGALAPARRAHESQRLPCGDVK